MNNEIIELTEDISSSPLYSSDLAPVPASQRTWSKWHIASIWVGMAVCIPTYMLASSLIEQGMNWWQALITILLGNVIVLAPMILNAHVGTKYGVPLPVFLRLSFGVQGAILASLFRGFVACGWFGIQTWIGGAA
ncbi:MAG: nitrate reductase, partial [Bacteroidetes bacterium CG_4_9_14_3_um_filter_41_19]